MAKLLEIAVFNLESAILAQEAGADRIELCDNAPEGGTTPSVGTLQLVKDKVSIPVFPIIRPRGGNFCYSQVEFESIKSDVAYCRDLHFEGVVLGMLHEDGSLHQSQLKQIVRLASSMQITFHRAFDRCKKPEATMEQLIDLGVNRILTSGQFPRVMEGVANLKKYTEQANGRIIIMPGSGLSSENVNFIASQTRANEFHTAARKTHYNHQIYSPASMQENLNHTTVNKEEVRKIKSILSDIACVE